MLKQFGGPTIPATGFGIGDCVLGILLEEKALLKKQLDARRPDFFVAYVDEKFFKNAIEVAAKLRRFGLSAEFSYKSTNLSKQLKEASTKGAQKCIIIGEEFKKGRLSVKDMTGGKQITVDKDEFLVEPGAGSE